MKEYKITVPVGIAVGNDVLVKITDEMLDPSQFGENDFVLTKIVGLDNDGFYHQSYNCPVYKSYYKDLGSTVFLESDKDIKFDHIGYDYYKMKLEYRTNWPIDEDIIYYINTERNNFGIKEINYDNSESMKMFFDNLDSLGLVFKTKEDAIFAMDKLRVITKLRKLSKESIEKNKDRTSGIYDKFIFITYYVIRHKYGNNVYAIDIIPIEHPNPDRFNVFSQSLAVTSHPDYIYFSTEDDAANAWREIGEDNMLKYYFGFSEEFINTHKFEISLK